MTNEASSFMSGLASRKGGRVPNFLVVGAMKAGTTSLYRYMKDHPQVFMPSLKEPDFFRPDGPNWRKGLDWYLSLFEGADDAVAIGEASVGYTMHPHSPGVPQLIARFLPDARLIYLVRDPIARMVSQYRMRVANGREQQTLAQALLSNPIYVDLSSYAMQLRQYREHYPAERLLVVPTDDLEADREEALQEVFSFIGVDPGWRPPELAEEFNTARNRRVRRPVDSALRRMPGYSWASSISPPWLKHLKYRITTRRPDGSSAVPDEVEAELKDRLRTDVRELYAYLDGRFDGWGIA